MEEGDGGVSGFVRQLKSEGYQEMGQGSFGVIYGNASLGCAVKVIKDLRRCKELDNEKEVYELLRKNQPLLDRLYAKVPLFFGYYEYNKFCQFTKGAVGYFQRITSPLSGFGGVLESDNGCGYVVDEDEDTYLLNETNGKTCVKKSKDELYVIDRPGSLIHFYINHFDVNLKERLENGQGVLMGRETLLTCFGEKRTSFFVSEIAKVLAVLVAILRIVPTDIEIVLGTTTNDRVVRPFVLDFNESYVLQPNSTLYDNANLFANALKLKNGKHYIPQKDNPYYKVFWSAFVSKGGSFAEEIMKNFISVCFASNQ